jgi:hypothetical protein
VVNASCLHAPMLPAGGRPAVASVSVPAPWTSAS